MTNSDHTKILGIGFAAFAGILLFTFILLLLVTVGVFVGLGITMANETGDNTQAGIGVLGGVFTIIFYGVLGLIWALPPGVAAWKLLKRRKRARFWGIVASIVMLAIFPLGTILGMYGLWFFFIEHGKQISQG